MHTARTIGLILLGIVAALVAVVAATVAWLGVGAGAALVAGVAAVVVARYWLAVRPWHRRWGATDGEVAATLPGDDLVPEASTTTRATSVAAPPEEVWPWLVQIGFGRAGWYSYDWIDNDGHPSADALVEEWQHPEVGDRILMAPGLGFVVEALDPPRSLVAAADDGSTSWCLHLAPTDGGCRLVSRFRSPWHLTPLAALMVPVLDPGAFLMERKMLQGIAERAERRHALLASRDAASDPHRACTSGRAQRHPRHGAPRPRWGARSGPRTLVDGTGGPHPRGDEEVAMSHAPVHRTSNELPAPGSRS